MEEHIRNGHIPKKKECPVCQQSQGPVDRHYQHPTTFEQFGTRHVDLTGPLAAGLRICADHGPQVEEGRG
eukprot:12807476-Prorocentrum_lima.AAC.1